MTALFHTRSSAAFLCDQQSSKLHLVHLPHQLRQPQRFLSSSSSNRSSSSSSSSSLRITRRYVKLGRRDLLHSTALLTLPTTLRSDATGSHSQLPSISTSSELQSNGSTSVSDSRDVGPVLACRPPTPALRISAPGRIVAGMTDARCRIGNYKYSVCCLCGHYAVLGTCDASQRFVQN